MVVFGSRVRDRVLWFGIVMNTMVGWLVGWLGCDCLNFEIWESRDGVVLFLFVWDLDSGQGKGKEI